MKDLENAPIRDIGWARQHLTTGQEVRRRAWAPGVRIYKKGDELFQIEQDDYQRRWDVWQADVLATDWELA